MSVPVVATPSSVLSFDQWLFWTFTIIASGTPYDFRIDSGSVPPGMSFQPSLTATGSASGDTINATAHGLVDGTCLVARTATGGTGLSTNTRYFVVNAATDTFQLATTPGGAAIDITVDYSALLLYQPGILSGAATVPGVYSFTVYATNGTGESAAGVTFSVGIKPASAAADGTSTFVMNTATGDVIKQTNATLNITPVAEDQPAMVVKEGSKQVYRLRFADDLNLIDLGTIADNAVQLVVKELEPENEIVVSVKSTKAGSGATANVLVYVEWDGSKLAGALSNYEADTGTFFLGLAEFRVSYGNPGFFGGDPATLQLNSKTFLIRIDRDL